MTSSASSVRRSCAAIPGDGHVNLQGDSDIHHVPQYDFERLLDSSWSTSSPHHPEVSFQPQVDTIRQVRTQSMPFSRPFPDLPKPPEEIDIEDHTLICCDFIYDFARGIPMLAQLGLHEISLPSPFFLDLYDVGYYADRTRWTVKCYVEPDKYKDQVFPHLTLLAYQPKEGRENALLHGELVALVSAMRSRAFQLKVDTEAEQELLMDADEYDVQDLKLSYPYLFPEEETFPTLLISAVGPRNARIIYGCMEGRQLVVRQSRLYSFARGEEAPVELFAALRLSRPVTR
ncbi:hypothetical protein ASPACDRAFT_1860536 [Aspergillus aculeatus ATCC 16872]|uniref:Uncharacterized protein n=1 Tax=Aspergillus aculeatus (strain ATCC 16872 / CBS 172.66 / WB 5094) TaxID=690307 RepID=A0A1L9WFH1_ASPA1|nr:uncharacterized protein ASPACDRAFT_1860536 [Aspergillus aculeatus ATCC 16872]OJJ94847.1 hypothetical protein ASPACDRAFT_1860536 [Aspergillus aculeatus ATCC 16872]